MRPVMRINSVLGSVQTSAGLTSFINDETMASTDEHELKVYYLSNIYSNMRRLVVPRDYGDIYWGGMYVFQDKPADNKTGPKYLIQLRKSDPKREEIQHCTDVWGLPIIGHIHEGAERESSPELEGYVMPFYRRLFDFRHDLIKQVKDEGHRKRVIEVVSYQLVCLLHKLHTKIKIAAKEEVHVFHGAISIYSVWIDAQCDIRLSAWEDAVRADAKDFHPRPGYLDFRSKHGHQEIKSQPKWDDSNDACLFTPVRYSPYRDDIYCLGLVIWSWCTGRHSFDPNDNAAVRTGFLPGEKPPLDEIDDPKMKTFLSWALDIYEHHRNHDILDRCKHLEPQKVPQDVITTIKDLF